MKTAEISLSKLFNSKQAADRFLKAYPGLWAVINEETETVQRRTSLTNKQVKSLEGAFEIAKLAVQTYVSCHPHLA